MIIAILASCWSGAWSGECIKSQQDYLQQLEGGLDDSSPSDLQHALWCLRMPCIGDVGGNRWAGPNTKEVLRRCTESEFRSRLVATCKPYLAMPKESGTYGADLAYEAAMTLAHYGVSSVDDHDIFEMLTTRKLRHPFHLRWLLMALAAQDDPRTVSFLAQVTDSLRTDSDADYENGMITVLNCLYHITDASSLDLARSIVETEQDPVVIERAKRVLDRK